VHADKKLTTFLEVEAELNSVEHIAAPMKSNKTGCPPERGCDLESCIVGASKAAWFAFIAIGWQRYPLAQVSVAVKGLTHELLENHC